MEIESAREKDQQRSQSDTDTLLPSWSGVQAFCSDNEESGWQWSQKNHWVSIGRNWRNTAKHSWKTSTMALRSLFTK